MPTVDFDRELQFRTVEIENVAIDWMLSAELEAEEPTSPEPFPEPTFASRFTPP
jgi:hypothetical protein